jgi:hypothetical protein
VDHVDFEREVLAVNAVLGGSVDVKLSEFELVATEGGGAVHDNLDGGVEVLKLNSLLGNVDDGLLSSVADRAVCACVSEAVGDTASCMMEKKDLPMLIGLWFFPALHASFSGASAAQLRGPRVSS